MSSAASEPPPGRLPRLALAALALIAGCSDRGPRILEVAFLHDTDDPAGPYRIVADVRGGDGETTVVVRLSDRGIPALVAGACADGPPPIAEYEQPDAAPPEADAGPPADAAVADAGPTPTQTVPDAGTPGALCHEAPMRRVGARWQLDLYGPPYPYGARVDYYVEARDADGDLTRWPRAAPDRTESFRIGPPGRAPVVGALAPTRGPATGGTEVLLRGEGFAPGMLVRVGGAEAERVEVRSPEHAVVTTPAGPPGVADLEVERLGRRSVAPAAFTFEGPPALLRVLPGEGPTAGGTWVVLEGAAFADGARVDFGDLEAEAVAFVAGGVIGARAPASPPGVVDVVVTNPDGQSDRLRAAFRFWPPPVIEAVEPDRGPDFGGNLVTLRGAEMRSPGVVLLDGREARTVEVEAGGRVARFEPAPRREGSAEVVFVNPDGQVARAPVPYFYLGPPRVDSVEPPVASRCGGGVVTLVGRNFDPAMLVFFGDAPAEVVSIEPDGTRAVVRAPPGEPGPVRIRVVNPDGRSDVAEDVVVYGVQPVVEGIEPVLAPIWGCTLATLRGGDLDPRAEVTVGGVPAAIVDPSDGSCDGEMVIELPGNPPGPAEVVVTNPDGISGSAPDAVVYVAPRLEPAGGLTPGYTTVALTGPDLRPGLRISIGGTPARRLEPDDADGWRFVTPAGARGPADVEVRNADGCGAVLEGAFEYRVLSDQTEGRLDAPGDCNDVSVGDVDGDGDLDHVAANGALISGGGQLEQPVAIQLNDGTGRFRRTNAPRQGNGMNVKLGDMDGDGDLDLLVSNLSSASNFLFRNDGAGNFATVPGFAAVGPSYDADWLDADGDGDLDIFLIQTGSPDNANRSGPEQLFLNDGRGVFSPASAGVYFSPGDVHDHDGAFGDVTGDGRPDVVITVDNISPDFRTAENRLLVNVGGSPPAFEFRPAPFNRLRGDWLHVELADLDSDGDLDVLMPQDFVQGISSLEEPPLALYLNDGEGNFEPAHDRVHDLPRLAAYDTETVDIDGDGDPDILVGGFGSLFQGGFIEPTESWLLLNDGRTEFFDGSDAFEPRRVLATTDFGAGDFDGDGDVDLVECAEQGGSVLWVQMP